MYDNQPGVLDRLMRVFQFAQMMKAGKFAEEDRALRMQDRAMSIERQKREEGRQRTQDQLTLHQMGASPVSSAGMYDVDNGHEMIDIGGGSMYQLPTLDEQADRQMGIREKQLRTEGKVRSEIEKEDWVDVNIEGTPLEHFFGGKKILKVPMSVADNLYNVANPQLHPYTKENDKGDVTVFGVNPRNMQVTKGSTLFGAGKSKSATTKGKAAYTSHDLDVEAEAQAIAAAQKQYGEKLMIEPPEVQAAITQIKKDHSEFDDNAAREYLMRIGPRLPQFKGLFDERGRIAMQDYRKSAQFRRDFLTRRIELKKKYESESAKPAQVSDADRQQAQTALDAAIAKVEASALTDAKKKAAVAELRRLHEARWGKATK